MVRRPGHVMTYLFAVLIAAFADGDLEAGAGFPVNPLDVRHSDFLLAPPRQAWYNQGAVEILSLISLLRFPLPVLQALGAVLFVIYS